MVLYVCFDDLVQEWEISWQDHRAQGVSFGVGWNIVRFNVFGR